MKVPEAPLPFNRIKQAGVFEVIGIDLGGPLHLQDNQKSWFVIFTCAVYRAIHLELVTSLSTEGFLQAFRRFVGRRGRPLLTVLIDTEEIINSRPLTYCTEDINDLIPLTPNLFIRDSKSGGVPDLDVVDSKSLVSRLKYRQSLRGDLRRRFRVEYLGLLVHRMKTSQKADIKVGDLVLIHSDLKKRVDWPLGKIEELFKGKDGVIRVARVKTSHGILIRPIKKLVTLEINSEDSNSYIVK